MSDADSVIEIGKPSSERIAEVVDSWARLVASQQEYGTKLLMTENRATAREWLAELLISDRLLVATADDDLCGFVTFAIERDRFDRGVVTGLIHNLFVEREYRNQGIGSELLAAAEESLRDRGAARIRLEVMARNVRAGEFYERDGYEKHRITYMKSLEQTDTHNGQEG